MSAFGLNRFAQAYAVAVNAAGTRIADKPISCVDRLASDLFEWFIQWRGSNKELKDIFRFVYPFVGNTAVSNSFSLSDPTTARITWNPAATIVHNAFGWTADSTNGDQANTGIVDDPISVNSYHCMWGVYSRSASAVGALDMQGDASLTPQTLMGLYCRNTDGRAYFWCGSNVTSPPSTYVNPVVPNSQGLFSAFRQTPPDPSFYVYRNGINIATSAVAVGVVATNPTPWTIGSGPTSRNYSFAFLTWDRNHLDPLSTSYYFSHESQSSMYSIVQAFQQRLGRSV